MLIAPAALGVAIIAGGVWLAHLIRRAALRQQINETVAKAETYANHPANATRPWLRGIDPGPTE